LQLTRGLSQFVRGLGPRYNIAPSDTITAIFDDDPCVAGQGEWGLHWPVTAQSRERGAAHVLPREDAFTSRQALPVGLRRCIIPADGYYEWPESETREFPELFTLQDDRVFMFAGVWVLWNDLERGRMIRTCALLTTEANALVAPTHQRMPAILSEADEAVWLNGNTPIAGLRELLEPFSPTLMRRRVVSCRFNHP
jgi:putative SOS response-associated peptidase YedK